MHHLKYRVIFYLCISLLLLACEDNHYGKLQGFTMGTSYHVAFADPGVDQSALHQSIETRLEQINQRMSTYIETSELMQLNAASGDVCFPVSADTLTVMLEARRIYQVSQGAFNPALGPLIELWGFDRKDTHNRIPTEEEINRLRHQINFGKIEIDQEQSCIKKGSDDLFINLSAIAKGYAVDEIAKLLEQQYRITDYLVEIGGELKVRGHNSRNKPWNIAIESPTTDTRAVQKIINPGIMAVATSGDYRNYFERDGKRYSHTIDPVSGYPISHALASVTVLHPSTMTADALATAMMVLGEEKAMKLAKEHHWAVFMIVKTQDGFIEQASPAFEPYLQPETK
jgi:thiamine biosynthesis lipoprotein